MVLSEDLSQESHPCLWSSREEHEQTFRNKFLKKKTDVIVNISFKIKLAWAT